MAESADRTAADGQLSPNTHYAVLAFSGDPACEHPDPELNGSPPKLDLIAAGDEEFCWDALARWTADHPLRMWEDAEVLTRHPSKLVIGTTP